MTVKDSVKWKDFRNVKLGLKEAIADQGVALLNEDRTNLGKVETLDGSRQVLALLGDRCIKDCINQRGRLSLAYFIIRQSGASRVRDLSLQQLSTIERFMKVVWLIKLRNAAGFRLPLNEADRLLYYTGKNLKTIGEVSAKEFRDWRNAPEQICRFKFGLNLTPVESSSCCYKLNRLTSVRHKSLLLRIAHGEMYTRDRLFRFNLIDSDRCHICGEVETIQHMFMTCTYARRIWQIVENLNGLAPDHNVDPELAVLGAWLNSDKLNMTVRAEILLRLSYQRNKNYVIRPHLLVKMAINSLKIKEQDEEFKSLLNDLL